MLNLLRKQVLSTNSCNVHRRKISNILLWQVCMTNMCTRISNFSSLSMGEDGDFQNFYGNFSLIGCLPVNINTMAILI